MKNIKLTTEEFIKISVKKHNNFYNYDKSVYDGHSELVKIECPKHGYFWQTGKHHLIGAGCNKCGREKTLFAIKNRYSLSVFLEKSYKIHGGAYDYSLIKEIKSGKDVVPIICKYHGVFYQKAYDHSYGNNCQLCSNYSNYIEQNYSHINKEFLHEIKGYLYVILCKNNQEEFYKVGITKNINNRLKAIKKFYKVDIEYLEHNNLDYVLKTEALLLKQFINFKYIPISLKCGYTECLTVNPIAYYYLDK